MRDRYGLGISANASIGEGFCLGHAFYITVNPAVSIGKNVNLHKGATNRQENRGKRKGAPLIGDNVWIEANASIVGRNAIGSDVLIAPNSYVNIDVPDYSIVLGNPCKVLHRVNATEGYLNKCV